MVVLLTFLSIAAAPFLVAFPVKGVDLTLSINLAIAPFLVLGGIIKSV